MDTHQMNSNEKVAKGIIENLKKRRMEGSYAATTVQAKEEILTMIPEDATVYRGGLRDSRGHGPLGGHSSTARSGVDRPFQAWPFA